MELRLLYEENGSDESSNLAKKQEERSSSNVSDEFEKIEVEEIDGIEHENIVEFVRQSQGIEMSEQIEDDNEGDSKYITKDESSNKNEGLQSIVTNPLESTASDTVVTTEMEQIDKDIEKSDSTDLLKLAADQLALTEATLDNIQINEQQLGSEDVTGGNGELNEELLAEITKEIISDDADKNNSEVKLSSTKKGVNEFIELETESCKDTLPCTTEIITETEVETQTIIKFSPLDVPLLSNVSDPLDSRSVSDPIRSSNNSEQICPSNASEQLSSTDVSLESSQFSILDNVPEPEVNSQEKLEDNSRNDSTDAKSQSVTTVSENVSEKIEQTETAPVASDTEKDSPEKIEDAVIPDISSPPSTTDTQGIDPTETVEEVFDNDEEEIEYEYEDSDNDNDVVDEEIRDVNRLDDQLEDIRVHGQINGENQEDSKCSTSSATLAENEISDEEVLENEADDEDEEVEEIIEYITDEEGDAEEEMPPIQANITNHIEEPPGQ